jgi:hypothetical protein
MRNGILALIMLAIVSGVTGCATTRDYFIDRARDASDIFTATIGVGAGTKARIGPLQTGLLLELPLVGLRGGELSAGNRLDTMFSTVSRASGEVVGIWLGEEEFYMAKLDRRKTFHAESIPVGFTDGMFIYRVRDDYSAPYYYTQIEAVLGLGASVRLGFNPGELLDFILGWATLDIFRDDLALRKRRAQIETGY